MARQFLPSGPGIEIDHMRKRCERLAAGQVILACQSFRSVGIVLELDPFFAVIGKDRLFAGLARRTSRPAAIKKFFIKKHATLQTFCTPHTYRAQLQQTGTRDRSLVPDNVAPHLLFRPPRLLPEWE